MTVSLSVLHRTGKRRISQHFLPISQISLSFSLLIYLFLLNLDCCIHRKKKCLSSCHKHWTIKLDFQELSDTTSSGPDFQVCDLKVENKANCECQDCAVPLLYFSSHSASFLLPIFRRVNVN